MNNSIYAEMESNFKKDISELSLAELRDELKNSDNIEYNRLLRDEVKKKLNAIKHQLEGY